MTIDNYKELSENLPHNPGVYRFINSEGTILYIGKAKNLKKRIASYFIANDNKAFKTKVMVQSANRIEFTIVESENDALILESTLIKKFQPKYNILLKDGKSYVYICIKSENFPRVFLTRKIIKDGSNYFGPYTSKYKIDQILFLIKSLFPLRTCNLNLSQTHLQYKKYKVCLEYHIKNCAGPCQLLETEEEYNHKIEQIKNILKGRFKFVKDYIISNMNSASERWDFEGAQYYKDKLLLFEDYQSKSTVLNINQTDIDVFCIKKEVEKVYFIYMKIIHGALINSEINDFDILINESEKDLLTTIVSLLREKHHSNASEIIVPFKIKLAVNKIIMIVPKIGDKKRLLDLAEKNLSIYILQKRKELINHIKKENSSDRILVTLRKDLNIADLPVHIECFDNSNIQGSNPVSSCIVFRNAVPSKRDYRKFKVKSVIGANDFASMEEIVFRRYNRLIQEGKSLPQLVIIDGGKGQLSAAMKSITLLGLEEKIKVIGIAKKLEEIYSSSSNIPLHINKKSESLKLIQRMRNEAHRFAISFHRDLRSKSAINSELDTIKGIGEKTKTKLLELFGSYKRICESDKSEISLAIGKAKSKIIFDHIDKKTS